MKTLPEKYYLTHFFELLDYLEQTSWHLVSDVQRSKLNAFKLLPQDAQCLLIRVVNRKRHYVCSEELVYDEIDDYHAAYQLLNEQNWLTQAQDSAMLSTLISELNKSQLMALAKEFDFQDTPVKSAKKALWHEHICGQLASIEAAPSAILSGYFTSTFKSDLAYFLFLFFGKLGGALSQFSMRDLGVMQTHRQRVQGNAHFESREEAQSAFLYCNLYNDLKTLPQQSLLELADNITTQSYTSPIGSLAKLKYDHLCYKLANLVLEHNVVLSESLLTLSAHPKAQEKYIRSLYAKGEHEKCKELIEQLLDTPGDEQLLFFAEDFYRLKFTEKRTSLLTDMLRASGQPICLDEAFVGYVEQGLIEHYGRSNVRAYHCENMLWRALFCLSFWHELFEDERNAFSNEFEHTPKCLKDNSFYSVFEAEIEQRLTTFVDNNHLLNWLIKQAADKFNQHSRLMFWDPDCLAQLFEFAKHAPIGAVCAHLRAMSKDFNGLKDGYPDLMLCQQGVKFVEVKAPGDSLRRNQLITIKKLIESGFEVSVQTVQWQVQPDQPYVIVDIETTGGKKEHDKITEIAMVKVVNGKIVGQWHSLINPQRRIPRYITELTGIDNEMVKDAPVFSEVVDDIDRFGRDAIFVAHNVNFDYGFIKAEFARLERPFKRAKLCTVQLGRKWLPGHASYSLGKICQALNIELNGHHRALNDALATVELFNLINQRRIEASESTNDKRQEDTQ
ncbi:exonuclease domain-containing protein [Pseudoalteromonas obscura]|uniref:Exonuclease domain-containing protein n=1 Tax=Pseudoalteromonas obscura TaxID=3048491 RepID=A0ABT7EK60_9GAMM|nr:exonuclease domain-containing protein [Pseudoalteromonas sp. P94(2023)]MDK2595451.1 exonuclease domain-containing protein [Pseudoalteromonas sp. P94(2023)]